MKIHDTKLLRERATSHAENDHVKQGTYGQATTNGKTTYQGCAVSCLATPAEEEILAAMIKEFGVEVEEDGVKEWRLFEGGANSPFAGFMLRDTVQEQFGIEAGLMEVAEGMFESQPTHGRAIEFIKDFAHSFEEGEEIDGEQAREWYEAYTAESFETWENVQDWIHGETGQYRREENEDYIACSDEMTKSFLEFCKDPTKIPVA